jgi:hypothetical protein
MTAEVADEFRNRFRLLLFITYEPALREFLYNAVSLNPLSLTEVCGYYYVRRLFGNQQTGSRATAIHYLSTFTGILSSFSNGFVRNCHKKLGYHRFCARWMLSSQAATFFDVGTQKLV